MTEEQRTHRAVELCLEECVDWEGPVDDIVMDFITTQKARDHFKMRCSCPKGLYYFSFVGEDRKFLGALIIRGCGPFQAHQRTHILQLNPGGSALSGPIRGGVDVPEDAIERLLTQEEVMTIFGDLF